MTFASEFFLPLVKPLDQALRRSLRVAGVDALLLARALFFTQAGSTGIPVVDLAGQPPLRPDRIERLGAAVDEAALRRVLAALGRR